MKEEGNGDGFMSMVEPRGKAAGKARRYPKIVAKPKWEFTGIYIIIVIHKDINIISE